MKKQKICIIGALGYIGTELCKLYSGEARYKDIVCLDNRFVSERVNQLTEWGMTFIQGSILDKEFLQKHLYDADVVYHLAGITDVAYTKTESNTEQDELIRSIGIDGTRNVVTSISSSCKLVFPSTHVIFEGFSNTIFNISEDTLPCAILTYAQGKSYCEVNIKTILKNHVIVRLGSVYGYSTDTMRINIMPNLFSKIASQNGTISLYSGGVQYKSLVHVLDVVRAMKYLAEGDYTGIYHLSNENMTIKEVAQICKEVNPKVTLIETNDEIPNLGYTLSNQKLLNTGFKFLYNIQDAIKEMINKWSYKEQPKELEYIIRGGKEYHDERGKISNYELTEPINLIGYIESRKGSVRANHYHPIQEQKCLLITGRYISVTKDLSYSNAPLEIKIIHSGDIAVIRPNVAHTMVFMEDSVFLNLVRGEREHENYGITHTIPYILVDDTMKTKLLSIYRNTCRSCGEGNLNLGISLGMSPLANSLVDSIDSSTPMYPLEVEYCEKCFNAQLSVVVPPGEMFDNYLYVSSTSSTFRQHFEKAAEYYIQEFNLTPDSFVLDIGSNDGVFLKPLQDRGIKVAGIEPAVNICQLANDDGIYTVHGYFDDNTSQQVYHKYGSPDLITASNVFAHADDLQGITNRVFALLKSNGSFIIEVQYLMDTMKDLTFDNIYHEHVNYWTVTSLANFFDILGYCMYKVEHIDTHGGSIRCYISREDKDNPTVQEYLLMENKQGINRIGTITSFAGRVEEIKSRVVRNITKLKQKFNTIAAYGSPAKATTSLNYFGIDSSFIDYTIEDNQMKVSKFIPGVNIPIQSKQYAIGHLPDVIIVLAWNFIEEIKRNNRELIDKGVKFISIKDLYVDDMPILDTTELIGNQSTGKVYDCFIFFNELDLLELRLNILNNVVDYFVIVEANITHSGEPKEFVFEQNRERFSKFLDKIIYVKVNDMPEDFTNLPNSNISNYIKSTKLFKLDEPVRGREQWQRACILRGLENCQDNDVIILSDLDEITNPDTLSYILTNFDSERVYSMRQNSYYYYLNLLKEYHWVGARIASYKKFCTYSPLDFRHIRDTIVANGGWHFSFQGTRDQVANKLQAYSHCDMVNDEVLTKLANRITEGIDPFNRGKLTKVNIDDTYPRYLLDNLNEYKHMILQ